MEMLMNEWKALFIYDACKRFHLHRQPHALDLGACQILNRYLRNTHVLINLKSSSHAAYMA